MVMGWGLVVMGPMGTKLARGANHGTIIGHRDPGVEEAKGRGARTAQPSLVGAASYWFVTT